MYKSLFKPVLDFVISLIGLILLSPVFLFVSIGLLIVNRGNPFFFQSRPGQNGIIFKVIKFKTMSDERGENGNLLPDEERLTSLGNFIRSISLDELPQLVNVLKGDMSLIGPRPLLPQYLPLYSKEQNRRHNVRPGITGWAQVNGRNAISWKAKFEYDVWYVDNLTFMLDLKVLLMTIRKIVKKEGIYSGETISSMVAFNGKN